MTRKAKTTIGELFNWYAGDLEFTLMGKLFTIQATDFYGEGVEI